MPELSWKELVAEIEGAIESGRFADAQRFLKLGEARYGETSEGMELRQRLLEIERLARPPQATTLVTQAEQLIQKADYAAALEALGKAHRLAPKDEEILRLEGQTRKALERQQVAIERNRALGEASREIGLLLDSGDLAAARRRLQSIGMEHGGHSGLATLRQRLGQLEREAQARQALDARKQAQALFEAGDWEAAASAAEALLRANPEDAEMRDIYHHSREHTQEKARQQQREADIRRAQDDVERLLKAHEVAQASRRLEQAVHSLGKNPLFDELAQKIHSAGADVGLRRRIEWAERRANEAERLQQEASRLSLQGEYAQAVQHLQQAVELDPSHPELKERLAAATAKLEQHRKAQERRDAIQAWADRIRQQLDGMTLEAARQTLQQARRKFGDEKAFEPLARKLERLREAERTTSELSRLPLDQLGPEQAQKILTRQRALRQNYPWQKALLFPFRSNGLSLFWLFIMLALVLDLLAALPASVALAFQVARWLLPLALLGSFPLLVRRSATGQNLLPDLADVADPQRFFTDLGRILGITTLAFLPCAVWIATHAWHHGLDRESGPLGFILVAVLAWFGCALVVLLIGSTEAFGRPWLVQPARHLRALQAAPTDILVVIDLAFLALALLFLLRTALVPEIWMGAFLVSVLEIYMLLTLPHLVGVLVRHRRLELARVYGGSPLAA